jgi:protein-tyrosine-phosphatase
LEILFIRLAKLLRQNNVDNSYKKLYMTIHFICRGNVFRSRMAEAYARSLLGNTAVVNSSGVEASIYPEVYISPFASIPLKEKNLLQFASQQCTLTSQAVLDAANVIVFVDPSIERDVKKKFTIPAKAKTYTWQVADIDVRHPIASDDVEKIEVGRETLNEIMGLVDSLLTNLKLTS